MLSNLDQKQLMLEVKTAYPHLSFHQWSKKTGIQVSRVFRIFHGKEMKISEYNAFHQVLKNNEKHVKSELAKKYLNDLLQKAQYHLPEKIIQELNQNIAYEIEQYLTFNS